MSPNSGENSNPETTTMEVPGIAEFFEGRFVLVTGATGFMGKVLVEKLVRSCPGLAGIYILVRTKRDEEPQSRLDKIINLPLFDLVREEARRKVLVVPADLKLKGLGLTPEWRRELTERVSVVFHSAATVRFNDPLRECLLLNTRGTLELVNLALEMPRLAVFLHVSTTYCNVDRYDIHEQIYPAHDDWRRAIRIAEEADEAGLRILTQKYLGIGEARGLPNTYTFAKSLAEHVVNDHADRLPAVIFRPSIVISTDSEPVSGWVDNFNGPMALLLGAAKGVVHVTLADRNIVADYIPVDICIKAIIVSAWKKATDTEEDKKKVAVYNCASSSTTPITMGEMVDMGLALLEKIPVGKVVWVPSGIITPSYFLYNLIFFFTHLVPALIADAALSLIGHKFRLMKVQRKLYMANTALGHFTTRSWRFVNEKLLHLDTLIPLKERPTFRYAIVDRQPLDFFEKAVWGGRRYLMKTPDHTVDSDRMVYRGVLLATRFLKFCFYTACLYLLLSSSLVQGPLEAVFGDRFFSSTSSSTPVVADLPAQ